MAGRIAGSRAWSRGSLDATRSQDDRDAMHRPWTVTAILVMSVLWRARDRVWRWWMEERHPPYVMGIAP
jgi:hypothetical protein